MGSIKFRNEGITAKETEKVQVKAEETKNVIESEISEVVKQDSPTYDDPAILYKDESRTNVYSEHYVNNNGTSKTIISSHPINYYDEETKKWKKIDLTVKEKDGYYESRAGNIAARFAKAGAGENSQKVEMNSGKQTVSWEYVGKASDGIAKPRKKAAALKVRGLADKSDTAVYEETEPDTDIAYQFDGRNLKENIIVKEKSSEYKYNFVMDTHGLSVRLSENNNSIEIYTAEDKAKGIKEKVEFYIPSPVMWDAEGNTSDEVYYEVGKTQDGRYEFSVIASEEWINAKERVFPITIDPQIVTDISEFITYCVHRKYASPINGQPTGWHIVNNSGIYAYKDSEEEYRTEITIKKALMDLLAEKIASVKILLRPTGTFEGDVICGESSYHYNSSSGNLEIDLTGLFIRSDINLILVLRTTTHSVEMRFSSYFRSEIEYFINENIEPVMKTFNLAGNVRGLLNLATRDCSFSFVDVPTENSVMGIPIMHTCKRSQEDFFMGQGYRLNLHENFKKYSERDYVYTDSMGYKHAFYDYYYYIDHAKKKIYINDKTDISVDTDGNLTYVKNGQKYKVSVEYKSHTGLKAITELEGLKNNKWLEQRSDEVKQNDSKVEAYKKTLDDFVILEILQHKVSIKYYLSSYLTPDGIDEFTNILSNEATYMLLTESEAYAYRSLYLQRNSFNVAELSESDEYAQEKYNLMLEQLAFYKRKTSIYITQIQQYFKEYYAALKEQQKLKQNTPVNFLSDGKVIKGYNRNGELVIIFDAYENYALLNYEPYHIGHTEYFRIVSLSDNKNNVVSFVYNSENRLAEIIDTKGHRAEYVYHSCGILLEAKYDSGETLSFLYDLYNLISVSSSKTRTSTQLTHSGTSPVQINSYSMVDTVSDGHCHVGTIMTGSILINYDMSELTTTLSNEINIKERYSFDSDNALIAYEKEKNGVIVQAERYEYVPYWIGDVQQENPRKVVMKADRSCLYTSSLDSFSFVNGETRTSALDQFNNPVTTTISGIKLNADGTNALTSVTTYTYDENQKIIEEQISEQYTNLPEPVVSYVRYNYNTAGDVIRKESFVESEEYTNGKTVEETVYDDKGNVIKTFTYNTLDASSKYYAEKKFDEDGKVISEANESGEYTTEYEYAENTGDLNTVKYVNGSKLSYGRDVDGTVLAITQSDENGEGNGTELSYTCGELTKATSGNNEVKYHYDGKRRVTQIDLNGTEEYLKNAYTDNVSYSGLTLNVVETENKKEEKFKRWFYKSGEIKQVDYNNDTVLLYDYNAKMQMTSIADNVSSMTHAYLYDALDRQIKHSFGTNSVETEYDDFGSVSKTTYKYDATVTNNIEYTFTYSEDSKRMLKRLAVGAFTEDYETDALGRTKGTVKTFGGTAYGTNYGYYKVGDHATNLINTVYRLKDGITKDKITYTYDGMGNIISVNENGRQKYKYNYDKLGKLLFEKDIWNDKEIVYTYDNKGNILTKTVDGNTIRYTYEEGTDKLLSFGNESFAYDVIGNPTTFRNMTATWNKGRQLTSLSDGTNTVSYTYDGFGLRKSKSVNGITTEYIYADGKLLRQTGSNTIDFIYGADGITGIKVGDASYLFIKNIQGDVEKIINSNGDIVGEYAYTAYGECTIINNTGNIAEINPIRYRGYYYDEETSLYYLKSRYYDPELGRFMTIDDISYLDVETINGLNLYIYCGNNPVMRTDVNGTSWWSDFWGGVGNWFKDNLVKLVIGAAFIIVGAVVTFFTAGMGTVGLLAAGNAILASVKAVAISMAINAGIGTVVGWVINGPEGAWQGFYNGLADGFMWGGIFGGSAQILGGASKLLASRNINYSDKINWLFGNRNAQSTTILRVNNSNKQLFRIDADITHLWHLHFGKTSALMRIHRTNIVLFSYLGVVNIFKGIFGDF